MKLSDQYLDSILVKLCRLIVQGQEKDHKHYGKVACCIIDPAGNEVFGINLPDKNGLRIHAERIAARNYYKKYGKIPKGSVFVVTLSPCDKHLQERHGNSCTDFLNGHVERVYCGYIDPTQNNTKNQFAVTETKNQKLKNLCKSIADTFLPVS